MSAVQRSSGQETTTVVDNEIYNLIASLSNKLQGFAAYAMDERDGPANDPGWQELRQQDEQAAGRLVRQLEQFAQQGKLQAKQLARLTRRPDGRCSSPGLTTTVSSSLGPHDGGSEDSAVVNQDLPVGAASHNDQASTARVRAAGPPV